MICPQCNDGIVVVDIKIQAAYSDMRESWPERLDITYKCNVCLKPTILSVSKYPKDLAGLRGMIQKQLNAEGQYTSFVPDNHGANYPGNS